MYRYIVRCERGKNVSFLRFFTRCSGLLSHGGSLRCGLSCLLLDPGLRAIIGQMQSMGKHLMKRLLRCSWFIASERPALPKNGEKMVAADSELFGSSCVECSVKFSVCS